MALAPAVESGSFSFAGDSLFVKASGNNLHRRATVPELRAHFAGAGGSRDQPAHWYEAQLLHYGLPPSKAKGTAKMRLYDAVQKTDLAVPAALVSMESSLKKAWKAQQNASKKTAKKTATSPATTMANSKATSSAKISRSTPTPALKKSSTATAESSATATAKKRKAPSPDPAKPAAKKRAPSSAAAPKRAPAKKAPSQPILSTSVSGTSAAASSALAAATTSRPKQTARRGQPLATPTGGTSHGDLAAASTDSPERIPMARRGGHHASASRTTAAPGSSSRPSHDDPFREAHSDSPPSYAEATGNWPFEQDSPQNRGEEEDDHDSRRALRPTGRPLGLINGRYDITCSSQDFPGHGRTGSLILTLDRDRLWGSINMGVLRGIMRLDLRPYEAAEEHLSFYWRGYVTNEWGEEELYHVTRPSPVKWLAFPGDGEIKGSLQYGPGRMQYFRFEGSRVSGQQTRSEISPREMRSYWEQLE